jgi:hypothetical protein
MLSRQSSLQFRSSFRYRHGHSAVPSEQGRSLFALFHVLIRLDMENNCLFIPFLGASPPLARRSAAANKTGRFST